MERSFSLEKNVKFTFTRWTGVQAAAGLRHLYDGDGRASAVGDLVENHDERRATDSPSGEAGRQLPSVGSTTRNAKPMAK
jgi:hypothetical protein